MKNLPFFLFVQMFCLQQLFAVPAYPNPINYTQPDGSKITIQLRGDERINWSETLDGFTLLRNSERFFEYATLNEIGDLVPSGIRVNDIAQRTNEEHSFLRGIPRGLMFSEEQIEIKFQLSGIKNDFLYQAKAEGQQRVVGSVRIPIILVGFSNRPFTRPANDFYMLLNQLGYSIGGVTGSVRDYFLDISYNQLDLQAEIFGPFTLPGTASAYANQGGSPQLMATLAVDSAYLRGGADFSTFHHRTVAGVPTLSAVHIIFAGHGAETGIDPTQHVWSHASSLSTPRTYNGIRIVRYSCSPEFRGPSGQNLTHIGVIAHELGHSLFGWPDSYSVVDNPANRCIDLGDWCLMASGPWNNGGATPPRPSAWFVVDAGWVPEITLTTPQNVTIPNPLNEGRVYRINTATTNEYFLLENRQRAGWDAFVPGSGMLIYHVDRTPGAMNDWNWNRILSNCNRRRLYIKQPGCTAQNGCTLGSGDTWPRGNFTEFTDNSVPNARSWAGANTNQPVVNITHNTTSRTISFTFGPLESATVPYFEGFESTTGTYLPTDWTSSNSTTWISINDELNGIESLISPRTGTRQIARSHEQSGNFAWAFTQPIQLYADTAYTISFWYRAPGYQLTPVTVLFDNFKAQIGPSRTLTGTGSATQMEGSTTIIQVRDQRAQDWTQASIRFKPTTSGPHYIGFQCMTIPLSGYFITIDDISITVNTDTASSILEFMQQHDVVQVSPNPFSDEIHITNAKVGSTLYILNLNGIILHSQRITNETETIRLGHLPQGVYILRKGNLSAKVVKKE